MIPKASTVDLVLNLFIDIIILVNCFCRNLQNERSKFITEIWTCLWPAFRRYNPILLGSSEKKKVIKTVSINTYKQYRHSNVYQLPSIILNAFNCRITAAWSLWSVVKQQGFCTSKSLPRRHHVTSILLPNQYRIIWLEPQASCMYLCEGWN